MLVAKGHGWTYLRAVGGLIAMLPALPRDRALARRIRRRPDRDLLVSAPIVVRDDLAANAARPARQGAVRAVPRGYWALLRQTVLAG